MVIHLNLSMIRQISRHYVQRVAVLDRTVGQLELVVVQLSLACRYSLQRSCICCNISRVRKCLHFVKCRFIKTANMDDNER